MDNNDNQIYQAPESDLHIESEPNRYQYRGPVARPAGDGVEWIAGGWRLFKQSPGPWIITMIVGFLIMVVANFVPIIGSLFVWLTMYVWIAGIMIGCQAVYEGEPFDIKFLFEGFKHRVGSLIALSLLLVVITFGMMFIAMGGAYFDMMMGDTTQLEGNPLSMVLSVLVVMALAIPLYMAVWFAPVLIVLQDMPVIDALKASFMGCLKNVLPFLIYGVVFMLLYILAIIPLLLGLLVLMPVFYGSMFSSYQRIFLQQDE